MPQKLFARHCPKCDRGVIGVKNAPSHLLHLILALVTFGLWIPIWILLTLLVSRRHPSCQKCGSTTLRYPSEPKRAAVADPAPAARWAEHEYRPSDDLKYKDHLEQGATHRSE